MCSIILLDIFGKWIQNSANYSKVTGCRRRALLTLNLQTHHVDSKLKRRGIDRFHVVSTWNPRGVFVGKLLSCILLRLWSEAISKKSRTSSFCTLPLFGSSYMTILCIQNEIIRVKIIWDFSMLLYEEVSRVLPEPNSN